MKELLKTALVPIYTELLSRITKSEEVCPFCIQWGRNFPNDKNSGILFVGKATNGWSSTSREVDTLFGLTHDRIFAKEDQMEWVNHNEGRSYNTKKSSFWRLIKKIAQHLNGKDDEWSSKIAWSNLYKVSYKVGNPNSSLKKEQKELCKLILEEEIKQLSPKFVVFLTSNWEDQIINPQIKQSINLKRSINWGKKYESKIFEFNDVFYIFSLHPQGKKEELHTNAILELIGAIHKN